MGRSILFLVGGLTILTGIIQVGNNQRLETLPEVTRTHFEEIQARNFNRSLVDNAIQNMVRNNDWEGEIMVNDLVDLGSIANRNSKDMIGGVLGLLNGTINEIEEPVNQKSGSTLQGVTGTLTSYTSTSQNIPTDNSVTQWDQYKLLLVSNSEYKGTTVSTEVLMQRDSFSKYSYMTQSELSTSGTEIWFFSSDNIYGPIHTNGTFKMSGNPSFYGLVTSPNMWEAHNTNPTSPNFYGGENFNAPYKASPDHFEIDKLAVAANNGGLTFSSDIFLDFSVDGASDRGKVEVYGYTTSWFRCGWGWCQGTFRNSTPTFTHYTDTFNGVISSTGKIDVQGKVKGNITVHSQDRIRITGDITYNTNPMVDSTSADLMGLVSEGDVLLDDQAHLASGSSDVTVHASIMALNSSFFVENYASGSPRGTLNLLGGIVQKNRGAVGTFNSSGVASGFAKNYQYDTRLRRSIPPFYPRESVFSIVYWKDKMVGGNYGQSDQQGS